MASTRPVRDPRAAQELLEGFSLEMTGKDVPGLRDAASAIPAGTKVNVTFLGSEDLEARIAAAKAVAELGFVPVPHISARRLSSQKQLEEFLERLQDIGASSSVLAIGGDPAEPHGPYSESLAIIRSGLLQKYGVRQVSIAGYPEGHPDIDGDTLWHHLEQKSAILRDQGLDPVILTQFGFDAEPVLAWITEARRRGIDAPIRVGTPGPAGIKRLIGYARRFGVGANAMIVKKYGFSLTNLVGSAGPDLFIEDLASRLESERPGDPVKLHFYTFGGLRATADWAARFKADG